MKHRLIYYDVRRNGETLFYSTQEDKALEYLEAFN